MRLILSGIVALLVACSPNGTQAQLGPGGGNEAAPGPLGASSQTLPLDREEGAGDTQESAIPDPALPSLPSTPPPDVDTAPLQEPLTLGPFEPGQTRENQPMQAQPQFQPPPQTAPQQQTRPFEMPEQQQPATPQPFEMPQQQQPTTPQPFELPQQQQQTQQAPQGTQAVQVPQVERQPAVAPGAATQFADAATQAALERLQEQEQLLEERQLLLDEREALLDEREAYLDERNQYLQERELDVREQAQAAAVQEDQVTVGEFFTGDAARFAEQFDDRPDRFQPGNDGRAFTPGLDGENFSPGPGDTRSPFFTTVDPPESP